MFQYTQEEKEQIKDVFARAGENISIHYKMQSRNAEMAELVNRYKQEEAAWYQSEQSDGNTFELTSQSLWYMHYLNKKRMQKKGIRAKYDLLSPTPEFATKEQRYPDWTYDKQGENVVCCLRDYERTDKTYYCGEKILYKEPARRGNTESYYITMAQNENGEYVCPGCGRVSTKEELLDGCDYCNSKFDVKDFSTKVSSVFYPRKFMQSRDGKDTWKGFLYASPVLILIPVVLVLAFIIMYAAGFLSIFIGEIADIVIGLLIPLTGMLCIGLFFLFIILGAILAFAKMAPKKSVDPSLAISRDDPLFSEEVFIAGLTNKILSLHYAEHMSEVAPFIEKDMSKLIAQCDSVIDCRLTECVLVDYQKDEEEHHMDVEVKIRLLVYEQDMVRSSNQHLLLRLGRKNDVFTNPGGEVLAYRCPNCGASVSLLTGGRCEYCDTMIHVKKYDWVIEDISNVKKQSKAK